MRTTLKVGQLLKHNDSNRLIKVIAVQSFINIETKEEVLFCTYYWNGFGLTGTDLVKNIENCYS